MGNFKKHLTYCIAVLGMVVFFLPRLVAQVPPDSTAQHFLTDAANANQFQVAAGTQALKQSTNEEVKQYGKMLVDHHTEILKELEQAAVAKKLVMPSSMEEREASMLSTLSEQSGADFDKAFKEIMINTHEYAVLLFERAANTLDDMETKEWIDQKVPALKEHLEQAKALNVE